MSAAEPSIVELEREGFVVLRATSVARSREKLRVAEALLASERDNNERTRKWAHEAFMEQRRLADRLTFVYGVARAHGATVEELMGDDVRELKAEIERLLPYAEDAGYVAEVSR